MNRPPFEEFYRELVIAQGDREFLPMNFNASGTAPYWNDWEMLTMLKNVNEYRHQHSLPLVTWEDIRRVEQTASGQIDYTKKFALYCAELAVKDD